jgi:hypothetical protein
MTLDSTERMATFAEVYGPETAGSWVPAGSRVNADSPNALLGGNDHLTGPESYGLFGEIVNTILPHTEADPYALLITVIVSFGASVGMGPYVMADGARHPARLFAVLVGQSSKGRKGTSWAQIRRVLEIADPTFVQNRVLNGFTSGEGLVDALGEEGDHRLFVVEPEWSRLLVTGRREGSTISPLLREAWDQDQIATRSRSCKVVAKGHLALIGHVTEDELRAKLLDVEVANGFANRHLFCAVKRSKLLPHGGNLADSEIQSLGRETRNALERARRIGRVTRSQEAEEKWVDYYYELAADDPGGMVGAITARDAAQVLRLSLCYALADGSREIQNVHQEAAWEIWQHLRRSVVAIFGRRTGNRIADKLLAALRMAGPEGLTTAEQHAVFGGHVKAEELEQARGLLCENGSAHVVRETTGGRPVERLVLLSCE